MSLTPIHARLITTLALATPVLGLSLVGCDIVASGSDDHPPGPQTLILEVRVEPMCVSGAQAAASDSAAALAMQQADLQAMSVQEVQEALPTAFALHANYPNPFNPQTEIVFDLPEAAVVRLAVYDVLGREVQQLVNGPMEAGAHRVRFEARDLPSGMYVYRMEAGSFAQSRRMVLMK